MAVNVRAALCAVLTLGASVAAVPVQAQETTTITVMTRNLYLGADVGPAMELLPDLGAAATFMWDQVRATDFAQRSVALATEVVQAAPDVIALQEATTWSCAPHAWSTTVPVYDFTAMLLAALAQQGQVYSLAGAGDDVALNPGFQIGPIPGLTVVRDPAVFQPLFGTDEAACGFTIADAVLVRDGLMVKQAGTTEYESAYSVVPVVMTVHRGYVWADVVTQGATVRVVATHLESLFDADQVPTAKEQADQLVADLAQTQLPLVIAGDFNSDPRDPRAIDDPNLGGQPTAGGACAVQQGQDPACSAYWTMRAAGYLDAGPSASEHLTWGYDALLTGPSPARPAGMTDRLDYVFTGNGATATQATLVGNTFPAGITWPCGAGRCAPSDHAGLVVTVSLPAGSVLADGPPPAHRPFPIGPVRGAGLTVSAVVALVVSRQIRARRARQSRSAPARTD